MRRRCRIVALVLAGCGAPEVVVMPETPEVPEAPVPVVTVPAAEAFGGLQYTTSPGLTLPEMRAGSRVPREQDDELKTVVVTRAAVVVAGREVLRLVDGRVPEGAKEGHRIAAVAEALAPELGARTRVVVLADVGLRYADLVDVLYSASEAGADGWAIGVRDPADLSGTLSRVITLEPSHPASGELPEDLPPTHEIVEIGPNWAPWMAQYIDAPPAVALYMQIGSEAVELGERVHTGEFRGLGRVAATDGWEPVRQVARDVKNRNGVSGTVVFRADDEVSFGRVSEALAAVTGDCERECWSARRVLVGGEMSLQALAAGRGEVTITEGKRRETHASGACSALGGRRYFEVKLGGDWEPGLAEIVGSWMDIVVEDGRTTVYANPEWREDAVESSVRRDRAITLTRRSGCARYAVTVERAPHRRVAAGVTRGVVDLDCVIGGATVRGRVEFAGCVTRGERVDAVTVVGAERRG